MDGEALLSIVRNESGDRPIISTDHPARGQRHTPPAAWVLDLDTIKIGFRAVSNANLYRSVAGIVHEKEFSTLANHSACCGYFPFLIPNPALRDDLIATVGDIGNQLQYGGLAFVDLACLDHRDLPSRSWAGHCVRRPIRHNQASVFGHPVAMRPPSRGIGQQPKIARVAIVFDAKPSDFLIDAANDCVLRRCYRFPPLRGSPDDVKGSPGQQSCNRIEIGSIDVTADSRSLERDRAAAAERIANARMFAKPAATKLPDEIGERARCCSEMSVDFVPDIIEGPAG